MEQIKLEEKELSYAVKEELKTLRTNIQFCGDDKKIILITSCLSGEGKSTTTLELAESLSELELRVLYIDADLRKDSDDKSGLKGEVKKGLTNFLVGQASSRDVVYSTNKRGLYVIPAGNVPPNPAELLAKPRMKDMLDEMRELFDYIIVDSAPLGLVVDAAVMAPYCDGSILLVESGTISYKFAQETSKQLKNTSCPIMGVILNKVDKKKSGYYGYGKYGKYGSYGAYGQNS